MNNIYKDISLRTNNNIYMGVVGPVRTGKSTFIKRIMELLIIPNIIDKNDKTRAIDELPQSAAGKTIMTTQPKFVPNKAIAVEIGDGLKMNVRFVDCVGYLIENAKGHMEDDEARMVMTPWYDDKVSFETAAETGTRKVIRDHSTISFVVTTDGSITDIPREHYEEAEERVVKEVRATGKPFVIILNSKMPASKYAVELAKKLSVKYNVEVLPMDVENMKMEEIDNLFSKILYEFPVQELRVYCSDWIKALDDTNEFKQQLFKDLTNTLLSVKKIKDIKPYVKSLEQFDNIDSTDTTLIDMGTGTAEINVKALESLFYDILSKEAGTDIRDHFGIMKYIKDLTEIGKKYKKISGALDSVIQNGYGIVMPDSKEMTLNKPQIVRKGQKFGIKLRANAPSIHMDSNKCTYSFKRVSKDENRANKPCTISFQVSIIFDISA